MMAFVLLVSALLLAANPVLDNEYAQVSRNAAPCGTATAPGCGARVFIAMGPIELSIAGKSKAMARGDIVVFEAGQSYQAPSAGEYFEVNIKPGHPAVQSPPVLIAPEKNSVLYDGREFFVFEEKLNPGETRARHSHSQRVVVVLNATRLQQWPEGQPEIFRDQVPDNVHFNPPVIHVVKTVGGTPLRNIVIEFKQQQ
jgi:hypothetical protein